MNRMHLLQIMAHDRSGCFGEYHKQNPLCLKHCVLRLGCAIEREYNLRSELIEELVGHDSELGRMQ